MVGAGITLALLSGVMNGLFTAPMKRIPVWRWENIWLVFISTACVAMPLSVAAVCGVDWRELVRLSPGGAVRAALLAGFVWGFAAIMFGLSVDRLGVSMANSLAIGLNSALGSLAPMVMRGGWVIGPAQALLLAGAAGFLGGVWLCGSAGRGRDRRAKETAGAGRPASGYLLAAGAGVISAVLNLGYTAALPIADAGEALGYSHFEASTAVWILMLGAGCAPNAVYCLALLFRNRSFRLYAGAPARKTWLAAVGMGLLWGGSIFLYGACTPMLGRLGPAIGWPVSLAAALLTANGMGLLLGEWRHAAPPERRRMGAGLAVLLAAILLCAGASAIEP